MGNNKRKSKKATKNKEAGRSDRGVTNNDRMRVLVISSGEDSSDDDVLCLDTMKEANEMVTYCFKEVKAITEKEVTGPELDNFCKIVDSFNLEANFRRVYKTTDESAATTLAIKVIGFNKRSKGVVVVDRNRNNQSIGASLLTTNKGLLPRMRYFTHSEQNIYTTDNLRLSHIPYIDDNTWYDAAFMEELRDVYPEGIHGTSRGCGEHIDDFMMWKLLDITLKKWTALKRDSSYIFRAISEMFPNKYSYKQLMSNDTQLTLKERFEGPSRESSQLKGDDLIGGISSLLCSKCLIFNCLSHPPGPDIGPPPVPPVLMPKRDGNSCGNECFLFTSADGPNIVPTLESKFLVDIFRAFVSHGEYNLCQVAKNMNRMCSTIQIPHLQCREWYSLLLSLPNDPSYSPPSISDMRNPVKQRERYKLFTQSLRKRNIDAINNYVMLRPCNHHGKSCEADNCPCFDRGGVCTKYCRCQFDCQIKFPGCTCSPGHCSTNLCGCFFANWECDPDTCFSCNCDVVHPIQSGSGGAAKICRNIVVQLKLQKHLKVGVSAVPKAGNGCFLIGSAAPGDLISEYTGEIISNNESERRGRIYDKMKCSYIFKLSMEKSLDAAKIGNLIRFANNDSKDPNCIAKTIVVSGEQRIAVYAKKHIKGGEELFFDYQYAEDHRLLMESSNDKKSANATSTSTKI